MMNKFYYIIANPNSGKRRGKRVCERVVDFLCEKGIGYELFYTTKRGDAEEFSKKITNSKNEVSIIAIGGDGTFSGVLSGIENFDNLTLGFIMAGTGNDFSTQLNINKDPIEALCDIIKGKTKYIDFIELGTTRSLNICGTGIDVDTLIRYEKARKKTKLAYFISLLKALRRPSYIEYDIHFENDEGQMEKLPTAPCLVASVCNGKSYGGGMLISPLSEVDDGLLDLIFGTRPNSWIIRAAMKMKKGKHLHYPFVKHIKTKKITITAPNKTEFVFQTDGEMTKGTEFSAEVITDKLKIYIPSV